MPISGPKADIPTAGAYMVPIILGS